MGDEMKKVIGAITEFALVLSTWLYILSTWVNGEEPNALVWIVAGSLLGKYGLQKGNEIITSLKAK
jgi:hypothetical protein